MYLRQMDKTAKTHAHFILSTAAIDKQVDIGKGIDKGTHNIYIAESS